MNKNKAQRAFFTVNFEIITHVGKIITEATPTIPSDSFVAALMKCIIPVLH